MDQAGLSVSRGTAARAPDDDGDDLDWELGLRCAGEVELLETLLAEMVTTWGQGAARIAWALREGGPTRAIAVAHALWGVAATLGAVRVRDGSASIELLLASGETSGVDEALARLDGALRRFESTVERRARLTR